MENELIETEILDSCIDNEVTEDVIENTIDENVSINDVSEIEAIPEKIILDDSDVENIKEDSSQNLEQLLRNYFSTNSTSGSEDTIEQIEGDSSDSTNEEETILDYTSILNDILTNIEDSKQLINYTYDYILEVQENNIFSSSIEDVSLTNQLLIVLVIILLFNGLLDFARRIF